MGTGRKIIKCKHNLIKLSLEIDSDDECRTANHILLYLLVSKIWYFKVSEDGKSIDDFVKVTGHSKKERVEHVNQYNLSPDFKSEVPD